MKCIPALAAYLVTAHVQSGHSQLLLTRIVSFMQVVVHVGSQD